MHEADLLALKAGLWVLLLGGLVYLTVRLVRRAERWVPGWRMLIGLGFCLFISFWWRSTKILGSEHQQRSTASKEIAPLSVLEFDEKLRSMALVDGKAYLATD